MLIRYLFALIFVLQTPSFARSPARETLSFTISTNVGFGNEVFVVGSHADVGQWDPTRAAKLYWTPGNVWTGQVGIQSGTALGYKYVSLPNSWTGFCNPANASFIPPGSGNEFTANVVAQPAAPYSGKTIFYHSGFTNVVLLNSTDGVNFVSTPMTRIGQGRSTNEYLYQAQGFGEAGEGVQFIPWDGGTNYDHAPYPGYGGGDYYTSLDVFFLQDGNVFSYTPPATLSASRIIVSNAVSTFPPSPNRPMKVYLPRGYDQNTWKRYPVIYMHDGENLFFPDVSGLSGQGWNADLVANKEISQGRMREVIIVGLNSTANRTQEYLPPEDNYEGQGFGDAYAKFVVHNVKAKIDAEFRTLTNRENTLTIGSSMGGLISTYLGWATNVFGKIGPFSPAYAVSTNFMQRINVEPKQPLRIFTEMGTGDSTEQFLLPATWYVLDLFLKDGWLPNADLISRIGCGQTHSEGTWQSWLPECYHFLLNLLDEPNRLAQLSHPPRITSATPGSATFMTLSARSYRLERSADLTTGTWQGVSTTAVETLPWAVRSLSTTNPTSSLDFLRIVAE